MSPNGDNLSGQDWLKRQTKKIDEQDSLAVSEDVASAVVVEAWLQRRGVKYAPATGIPMSMIDERKSRGNQARREPIVPDSVERFAASLRAGRRFPPIVVYAQGPNATRLVIVDGNNRHEAHKRAKRDYIFGITIDWRTDSDVIQLLTVEANAGHGVAPPTEWRIRQAFHLCSLGHPDDVAAEAAGLSISQLKNARAAADAEQRAKILKISGFSELPMTNKQFLNGLKLEPVFHAAAVLAVAAKLTTAQIADVVRKVKQGKSESAQLSILAEQHELLTAETAYRKVASQRISSPKGALASGIGMLLACDIDVLVNNVRTTHDRDEINRRLREAEDKILEIQVKMELLKDMEA